MMVQKKKRLTKTQRLLNAWAMRLANQLTEDYGLTQSNALRRAHMAAAVLGRLGKGVVTFCYRKANGEERQARGTLCHGISDDFDPDIRKHIEDVIITIAKEHDAD